MKEFLTKIQDWSAKAWKWIGQDGLLHISISALIMLAFGWMKPMICGVAVALAIGLAKECVDIVNAGKQKDVMFDFKHTAHDIICDIAGICIGVLVALLNLTGM